MSQVSCCPSLPFTLVGRRPQLPAAGYSCTATRITWRIYATRELTLMSVQLTARRSSIQTRQAQPS
jgi:hypothetical protein